MYSVYRRQSEKLILNCLNVRLQTVFWLPPLEKILVVTMTTTRVFHTETRDIDLPACTK
jgi:hypothetical protein